MSVTIGNNLTSIGNFAFTGCSRLNALILNCSNISNWFQDCINLYSVTSLINIPFKFDESAFIYTNKDYLENTIYMIATLYVPRGREAIYGQTDGWKLFTNIQATDTKFKLTYLLDGEEYKTYEIQATEVVTPDPDPVKEGYTFSGWNEIPWYMPAEDVVVNGSFTVNKYKVTFMYGNNELTTIDVEYGAEIPLPESLGIEGYTLIEWLDVPETMPAHDITIYANYTDGIGEIVNGKSSNGKSIYNLQGHRRSKMQRGINIVRYSDGTTKRVLVK